MKYKNIKPINRDIFNQFLESNEYELNAIDKSNNESVSDSLVLFNIVIQKLLEQGVQFSSPGNSPQRHFILWFNAQVDNNQTYAYQIDLNEKYLNLIFEIIAKICPLEN